MVQMDTRLPMMIQQPNILAALDAGTTAAANQANVLRQAEGQNLFRQYGAGAMQGDPRAMNALAGFDPVMAQNMQAGQLDMQATRQGMAIDRERIQMLRDETARALASAQDQAEAMREAQEIGMVTQEAVRAFATRDEAGFARATASAFGQPLPMTEEGLAALAAFHEGAKAFMEMRPGQPEANAKERDIALILEANPGMTRAQAINIVTDVLRTDRDPLTRDLGVVNMADVAMERTATMPVGGQPAPQPAPTAGTPALSFGTQFEGANDAFGLEGAVRGIANKVGDILMGTTPFPETLEAQRDFAVFGESLVNAFASAYGRQPPSWLLQNIAELTPKAGRIFEGPQEAQAKLRAIVRDVETRRAGLEESLRRRMAPDVRADVEGQIAGIDAMLSQVNQALGGFGGAGTGTTSSGIQWRIVE